MQVKIYIQEPGAEDGEPREGLFVECDSEHMVPLPQVGDEFFVAGMDGPELIERRSFRYLQDGRLHVVLFVKGE